MSVLGLIGSPAFAATKHAHHHRHCHKHVKNVVVVTPAPTVAPEPVVAGDAVVIGHDLKGEVPCVITHDRTIMDSMTQSIGRAMPNACTIGWFDRIRLTGGLNLDFGKFGTRTANYQGENYQRISINDAYINIAADVSDWAKAFASITYSDPTTADNIGGITAAGLPPYNAQYSSPYNGLSTTNAGATNFNLEQAYATIGNFNVSPVFVQFGKQFQDFSRYQIHPITRSMTQVLSEALATSIKLGFIANGFHGSIYAFDDPIPQFLHSSEPTNYGAALGYDMPGNYIGWDVGIAYMYNLMGAQDVADAVNYFESSRGYEDRASGVAVYGDINAGPFSLGVRYTTATQRFNALDLPKNGIADTTNGIVNIDASGAKPWAVGAQAGYAFNNFFYRDQTVYVGYQQSGQAAGISLPKNRWLAGYTIEAVQNTSLGIEWDHDTAYSVSNGGTGNTTNLVSLRGAVQFG